MPALKPTATNPWYVLMTVAGEQTGEEFDRDLHRRNRRLWNRWVATALSDKQKDSLVEDGQTDDFVPLTKEERTAIDTALRDRCPDAESPSPFAYPDLSYLKMGARYSAEGFLFPTGANYNGATFSKGANFQRAIFFEPAYFDSATFSETANFHSATFSEIALFQSATFSRPAFYDSATFSRHAIFHSATFSGTANFDSATFSETANFHSATFSRTANFSDATFEAATNFREQRLLCDPPTFFNAKLHEDTDFTDAGWPPVPDDDEPDERRRHAIQHRRAYERLKLLMDSQKRVADELMFQRLELRCREAEAVGDWREREWWVARVSQTYGVLSDYGWDPVRPALWIGGLILTGWAMIFVAEWGEYHLGAWPDCAARAGLPGACPRAEYLGFWQSGAMSLSNVFGFLGFHRTFLREEIVTLTTFSEVVSVGQTMLGLVLLFLFSLALRNRFRIK